MNRLIITYLLLSTQITSLAADPLTPLEHLGKSIFFDALLSVNGTQSCAFCHAPEQGFGSDDDFANMGGGVVRGAIEGRFGNRKPPSAAYAVNAPIFHHEIEDNAVLFVGGAFLDGRATGHQYGTAAADQAHQPFTNPVEMAMPHLACVVQQVCAATLDEYPVSLADVWGADICNIAFPPDLAVQCTDPEAEITLEFPETVARVDRAIAGISRALASYELSSPNYS
ncbi:MAG: cytochrome-c peroxidase [Rhodobacterales bacterium]|nr:cytochrome-c peroxidase [Rhodobacterales bacterium]